MGPFMVDYNGPKRRTGLTLFFDQKMDDQETRNAFRGLLCGNS